MSALLQLLARELEKPRPLPPQIIKHLASAHGISRDGVREFLIDKLPGLEDYEVEILLSPAFTPGLRDQSVFAGLLGNQSIPETEWPVLIATLASRPTRATLLGEDAAPIPLTLREVIIERYVHRLRLQGTIPDAISRLIDAVPGAEESSLLKAIARRAAWNTGARMEILRLFLQRADPATRPSDAVALLHLVETYQPPDLAGLAASLPHWKEVLVHQIGGASSPKPFFNERVQELHGGGRDQRHSEDDRAIVKNQELEFLTRLQRLLGS
ncbi:MAG: hypothetical protein QOF48_3904 [Verrucomicrobiota bacterium]|jgi:hypothetical protein